MRPENDTHLSPINPRNPIVDADGYPSKYFLDWLLKGLYMRVGQGSAITLDQLQALVEANENSHPQRPFEMPEQEIPLPPNDGNIQKALEDLQERIEANAPRFNPASILQAIDGLSDLILSQPLQKNLASSFAASDDIQGILDQASQSGEIAAIKAQIEDLHARISTLQDARTFDLDQRIENLAASTTFEEWGGVVVHRFKNETINGLKTFTNTITSTLGTVTASTPWASSTATWNNADVTFTHQLVNITDTTSASASLIYDYQAGSTSLHKLQKNGQTWFTVSGAGDNIINLNNAAGTNRYIRWETAGSRRWQIGCGGTAESGGNAGSAFNIAAYDDSAAFIDTPISIARVTTGVISIARSITMSDAKNFVFNTTTGTQIGTGTTQKLAFYGSAPLAQQASTVDIRTALINLGFFASGGANPLNLNGGALTVGSIAATGTVALTDNMTVTDAKNIVLGTTTGTKFGTATTQKLAFYNSTPIVQPSGDVITALTNLGLVATPTISEGDVTNLTTDLAAKAPTASPTFTGTVTAGTMNVGAFSATSITGTGTVAVTDTMTVTDAKNIVVGSTTGTKIGTATTQKLGFWNAAPVVQATAVSATGSAAPAGGTGTAAGGWDTSAHRDAAITLINNLKTSVDQIITALKNCGITA